MEVEIEFIKSAQENAKSYFEKSKKFKTKYEGALKSINTLKTKLKSVEDEKEQRKKLMQ